MAERLGTGLQNPLHRFESGSDLTVKRLNLLGRFYFLAIYPITLYNLIYKVNE